MIEYVVSAQNMAVPDVIMSAMTSQITGVPVRSNGNDNTGFWSPGSLHTMGANGHI